MIGFAVCGSFCTHKAALAVMKRFLEQGHEILPIMSEITYTTNTRFGASADLVAEMERLCGHAVIHTIPDAEPLGPATPLEALLICPCTGNTLAKIANGITDTPVCMAAKAHLRSDRPLLITLATNDALSANLRNIGTLLSRKSVYFTPLVQDDPTAKPHSLVADFSLVPEALAEAMKGRQVRPLFR